METRTKVLIASIGGAVALGITSAAVAGMSEHGRGGHMSAMVGMIDTDADGKITRAEADAFRDAHLKQFDANADGVLNGDEYIAMLEDFRRQMMLTRFKKADADGDGALSKDELGNRMDWMFAHLDRNDDGVIEADEMRKRGGHKGDDDDDDDHGRGHHGKDRD